MPFREDVFDLVLCEAAIEQFSLSLDRGRTTVQSIEIGCFVYADVAFLQPVHSYPNHYFNMTLEGVKALFEKFKLVDCGMQDSNAFLYFTIHSLPIHRCLFPRIDKSTQNIEVYDTGKSFSEPSATHSVFVSLFNFSGIILRAFDKRLSREKLRKLSRGSF